jgi:hypothetical protein
MIPPDPSVPIPSLLPLRFYASGAIPTSLGVGTEPISIDQHISKHLRTAAEITDVSAVPVSMRLPKCTLQKEINPLTKQQGLLYT